MSLPLPSLRAPLRTLTRPVAYSTRSKSTSSSPSKHPQTIFSGIQPTGIPHLGNYLGALSNWVKLQDAAPEGARILFSVVGLHALTLPQQRERLRRERREMLAAILATGVREDKAIVFHQDEVPEHAELAWILNCLTPVNKLQRMTTWKSKIATARNANSLDEVDTAHLNLGLFAYPVLQAADVILYKATHVPVGEDQEQHLELTRDLADLFNRTHGKVFPLPRHVITPAARVLSLRDPTQKMSKSHPQPASRILLTDPPSSIHKKLRSAVTDSLPGPITFDPLSRPGVSNLLTILSSCSSTPIEALVEELAREGAGMKELKERTAEAVEGRLGGVRGEFERMRGEEGWLDGVARRGRERAGEIARGTMGEVRRAVGLD